MLTFTHFWDVLRWLSFGDNNHLLWLIRYLLCFKVLCWALDVYYSFSKHKDLVIQLLALLSFFWWTNWALDGLLNLPKVTVSDGPEIWTLTIWYQRLILNHSGTSEERMSVGLRGSASWEVFVNPPRMTECSKTKLEERSWEWTAKAFLDHIDVEMSVDQLSRSGSNLKVVDLREKWVGRGKFIWIERKKLLLYLLVFHH